VPLLAHPERYFGVESAMDRVARWVAEGTLLQVNAGSLVGVYGPTPRAIAVELLARGWACCIAGDYHARGAPPWDVALDLLKTALPPAADWITRLGHGNPARLLADESPLEVEARAVDSASRMGGWRRR